MMRNAVVAIVKGGLGNQLFIYASARSFSLDKGRSLYLDQRRGYTHDKYERNYRLNRFPINAETMPEAWRVAATLKDPRHKLIRAGNKLLPRDWRGYIAERRDSSPDQLLSLNPRRDRVTLNGYWSDERYFAKHADLIRNELVVPAPLDDLNLKLGEEFAGANTVFVHARRKNYPTLLSPGYYRTAMTALRRRLENPEFVVFSDDHGWAKENIDFGGAAVRWVEHNADDEMADLWLMTRCRHAIIANSSFSWWGAWLGGDTSTGRIIFAPENPKWGMPAASGWFGIPFEIRA